MITSLGKFKSRLHARAGYRRSRLIDGRPARPHLPTRPAPAEAMGKRPSFGVGAVLACQFGCAFNDHFFKMLVSLAAISAGSGGASSAYLSLSGVIYVLPFLLFSGIAGYITDRFDKRFVMIATKGSELALAALATVGLVLGNITFLLFGLFLFAAQSAFFSPPKYGILPEIVVPQALPRANGFIEFSRYVAIIGGTAVAGVLSSLWGRDSLGLGLVIIAVALIGWVASFAIPRVGKRPHSAGGSPSPTSGIWGGIKIVHANPKLRLLVAIATSLDFAMTLLSLVVLLLAKVTMGLSDLHSGMLIALAGIGVALGSILAGHLSHGRAEIGFLPLGAIGAGAGLVILANSATSLSSAAAALALMGASTGFIVVPLYTGLQKTAPPGERGRVIGANNFFNMAGVLAGSGLLWVLHDRLGLTPSHILTGLGAAILAVTAAALFRYRRLRIRVSLLAAVALESLHQVLFFGLTRACCAISLLRVRRSERRN